MSQKLTKNSKNLVKRLKLEIKTLKNDRDNWRSSWDEERIKKEKKEEVIKTFESLRNIAIGGRTDALEQEISHLQEIIRWLIKPSTTDEKKKRPEDYPRFRGDRKSREWYNEIRP